MSSLWLLLMLFCLLSIYVCWEYGERIAMFYRRNQCFRNIPTCWPVHWLLGNLHQLDTTEAVILDLFNTHVKDHSLDCFVIWFSIFAPTLAICHPRLIKAVLKEPKAKLMYGLLLPWLGDGLLIANGDKWLRNRRLLTPAFHVQVLKQYMTIFNASAHELVSKWSSLPTSAPTTDVLQDFSLLTLDVMLQTAFSYKSHCQTGEKQSEYISSVMAASEFTVDRLMSGYKQSDLLFYLSPSGFKYRRTIRYIHQRTEQIIQERRMSLLKEDEQKRLKENRRMDLLDVLLTAKGEDGVGMPDEQIRNEVNTFLFEGHDTTASGLAWSLYCLAKYPEHQEKCRQEVMQVLGGKTELEWEDLKSLEYTTMCIKEAMRLYPPVPLVYRDTTEDSTIDGHFLPKGSWLTIAILAIHRNPRVWDNPEVYDPLRFTPENSKDRDPFAYIPFSAGPRNCIGQLFALNEERAVIAKILESFSISLDETNLPRMKPGVVLKAENGVWLNIKSI